MSSITECANENEVVFSQPDLAAKLKTRVYMGFAGTMALGLSLAGWYVGGRILSAEQPSSLTVARAAVISPVQTYASVTAPKESASSKPSQPAAPPDAPPAPQLFLEMAGLGARQDALYIRKLRAKGFSARADVSSEEGVRRILIGPFADRQAIQKAQRKLQVLGILALERVY